MNTTLLDSVLVQTQLSSLRKARRRAKWRRLWKVVRAVFTGALFGTACGLVFLYLEIWQ